MSTELLDRKKIIELFGQFAVEAHRRGVSVSLFLVGGGAIALAYNTSRSTRDLDAVFEPKQIAYDIAQNIADSNGLPGDWLNDAAKGFMPGDDPAATVQFEEPGLSVKVASPKYLFVMKALAARESDEDDLRILYRLAQFKSAAEALSAVEAAYPSMVIKPIVQYMVEGIASEFDR